MNRMSTVSLVGLLLAALPSSAFTYHFSAEKEEFSFVCSQKLILVTAQIEDLEGLFIFDTGASELILNKRYFDDGRINDETTSVNDIGRKSEMEHTFVKQFQWGSLHRKNFTALQVDLGATEALVGTPILGLIGYDVIRKFEVMVDYNNQMISLWAIDKKGVPIHASYPSEPHHVFEFHRDHHLPTLQVSLSNGHQLHLALDSGATVNMLSTHWKKKLKDVVRSKRKITFIGVLSTMEALDFYNLEELIIEDRLGIRFWRTALGNMQHFYLGGIRVDGFLGVNFFQFGKVAINYRAGRISVWEEGDAYYTRHFCLEHEH